MKRCFVKLTSFLFFFGLFLFGSDANSQLSVTAQTVKQLSEKKLLYLNAANFDFGNNSDLKYVGHLNIFNPSLDDGKWGINTGIFKINFNNGDSTANFTRIDNVIIDPLKGLPPGAPYLRQLNNYEIKTKNSAWSFYIQPTYRLHPERIYVHGHAELYVNKYEALTKIRTLRQDTAILSNPAPNGFVARAMFQGDSVQNATHLNGYFGAGLTFTIEPWANGYLFIQPTIGITTDAPHKRSAASTLRNRNDKTWQSFYLMRTYYSHKLSNSSTIILGIDIRGLFPRFDPQYGCYLGINLDIEKIKDLLTK